MMLNDSNDPTKIYLIAEIGANHNGNIGVAKELALAAKTAGADAVKFQSWDTLLFSDSFYDANPGLREEVEAYRTSPEMLAEIADHCRGVGIDFASTPFSLDETDALDTLEPVWIKVASMDLTHDELLRKVASKGRRVLLSTGFGSLGEIEHAVETIEAEGNRDLVLLHCVALYPPPSDEIINLRNIELLSQAFGYPVGFSDHTQGIEIPFAAMALGATVIEKHFTLDHDMEGWDHRISADPEEMKAMVRAAERIHAALGGTRRVIGPEERANGEKFRRSAIASRDIRSGEVIGRADVAFQRPGTGIAPNDFSDFEGMRVTTDIAKGAIIQDTDFKDEKPK